MNMPRIKEYIGTYKRISRKRKLYILRKFLMVIVIWYIHFFYLNFPNGNINRFTKISPTNSTSKFKTHTNKILNYALCTEHATHDKMAAIENVK